MCYFPGLIIALINRAAVCRLNQLQSLQEAQMYLSCDLLSEFGFHPGFESLIIHDYHLRLWI